MKAAKEVFERDGFLDARISDIAKRARVSYGAFYHYFDAKEQIFREVAEAQEERLTAPPDHDGADRRAGISPYDRILEANRRYLERYRDEARLMRVIEEVSRYDSHVNAVRVASYKHFVDRTRRSIRRLQDDGLADSNVDPTVAADALGSMIGRFAELWLTQEYRDYDFDEVVEQLSLLWANAIGLRDPSNGPSNRSVNGKAESGVGRQPRPRGSKSELRPHDTARRPGARRN